MQAALARMNEENRLLKGVLSRVAADYNALQMHIVQLSQPSRRHGHEILQEDEVGKSGLDHKFLKILYLYCIKRYV